MYLLDDFYKEPRMPLIAKAFFLSVFALSLLGPCVLTQRLNSQGPGASADHLWQIAQTEFGSTPITSDAASACRQLIDQGAPKVTDEAGAERDVRKLADRMVKEASFDETTGSKHIDMNAFKRAKQAICPLFPFC